MPSQTENPPASLAILPLKQRLVFRTPLEHGIDDGNQGHAQRCDGVLRPRRQLGIDGLFDQAILDQLLQLQVEHPRSRLGQRLVQFTGAHRPMPEFVQDTRFPLRVDQTHGQPQGTIQIDRYFTLIHNRTPF